MVTELSNSNEVVQPNNTSAERLAAIEIITQLIADLTVRIPKHNPEMQQKRIALLQSWREYLLSLEDKTRATGSDHSIIICTAILLDIILVDDIYPALTQRRLESDGTTLRATYARFGFKNIPIEDVDLKTSQIFYHAEVNRLFEDLASEPDCITIDTLEEIGQKFIPTDIKVALVFSREFQSIQDLELFIDNYKISEQVKQVPPNASFMFRVKLSNDVSAVILTNRFGVWSPMYTTHIRKGVKFQPSPLSTSTILQTILETRMCKLSRNEKPLVGKKEETGKTSNADEPGKQLLRLLRDYPDIKTWQRGMVYKKLLQYQRNHQTNDENGARRDIEQTQTEYYQKLLTPETIQDDSRVILTRSGVSANTMALMAANDILLAHPENEIKVCALPGWYFENDPPESWKKSSADNANVLLVGIEPNNPTLDISDYRSFIQLNISTFVQQAKANLEEKFVLIVDKTTNIFDETLLSEVELPENVLLFETASLTKHQRGGRYYFYGIITCHNNSLSREQLIDIRTTAMGTPTKDSLYSLPRLRKSEVAAQIEHNRQLGSRLAKIFEETQGDLPTDQRWTILNYNYYCFILPPRQILRASIEDKVEFYTIMNGMITNQMMDSFFSNLEKSNMTFEEGDSFGLNSTRIIGFKITIPPDTHQDSTRPPSLATKRIAFGRKTSLEEISFFGQFAADYLKKATLDYIE